jgi:dihydroflavonol-4-reductase
MERVLVTGATGFVGGRLARQLLEEGYEVRVLARTPEKAEPLAERGADVVEGDVTDPASLPPAMEDVDGLFHLAAVYELGGDPEWMHAVNVEGTRHVLDAAAEAGVERIVYCGSDTSLGDTRGDVCDESKTRDDEPFRSIYAETKYRAHEFVDARIESGQPIVHAIVSTVYGAGDTSPIADLIEHHLAGRLVAHLDREAGYTFTHVDDVATALRLAYERGEIGEDYLVSGTPATFETFLETLSEHTGRAAPAFELPDWLVDAVQPWAERIGSWLGGARSEIRETIDMGRNVTRFFSSEKARDELGWEPRSLEEGLREILPSFQRRERQQSRQLLSSLRWPLAGLALFDLALGGTALLLPETYMDVIHPGHVGEPSPLVSRTGVLWLVFSAAQGIAALDPESRPGWVFAAGVLRLMDVPADPVYYWASDDLGLLGTLGLLSAPLFNIVSGAILAYAGWRGLSAR